MYNVYIRRASLAHHASLVIKTPSNSYFDVEIENLDVLSGPFKNNLLSKLLLGFLDKRQLNSIKVNYSTGLDKLSIVSKLP